MMCLFCKRLYEWIIAFGVFLQPFILLMMRLYWGFLFFQAGFGKLGHIDDTGAFFSTLNIPFPWSVLILQLLQSV